VKNFVAASDATTLKSVKTYYISAGTAENKSHPDDMLNTWVYDLFTEPVRTFASIQKIALIGFVVFTIFSVLQFT
jgi:hypothetical protein